MIVQPAEVVVFSHTQCIMLLILVAHEVGG